jgi:hypothetical protein
MHRCTAIGFDDDLPAQNKRQNNLTGGNNVMEKHRHLL